jgi:hypothetical protein
MKKPMKILTALAGAALLAAAAFASLPSATAPCPPTPAAHHAKICAAPSHARGVRVAEADSCTEYSRQENGCYEKVCSRASDGACYIVQCCQANSPCTRLSCT